MKKFYVYLSKSWNMYSQKICSDWWSTYSYISLRGTSVARNEERNQISYIFQVHFTLKPGCDCWRQSLNYFVKPNSYKFPKQLHWRWHHKNDGPFNRIRRVWWQDVTTDYMQQEQTNYALPLVFYSNLCSFLIYNLSAYL
jgi:hypothetical protein